MPMRFLLEAPTASGWQVGEALSLPPEQSHYLCKVMRLKNGDSAPCFDGQGRTMLATVVVSSTKKAQLCIAQIDPPVSRRPHATHLGISLLKGQAMDRALQQATELGAASITLLSAKRGNVTLSGGRAENKLFHWRKIIAGACEQSGQLYVPPLHEPVTIAQLLDESDLPVVVLDQAGEPLPAALQPDARLLLIGPEGGWHDSEQALFNRHSVKRHALGDNVLRAETVPAVALALMDHLQRQRLQS